MFETWNPRRRRAIWLVAGLGVFVFVAGIVLIVPRLPAFKTWRSDRLAVESLEALDRGEWDEAHRMAVAAYQLNQSGPLALRAAARLNAKAMHPQAVYFFENLIKSGEATPADRLEFAGVLLALGRFEEFRTEHSRAVADGGDGIDADLLLARYAAMAGDAVAADAALRQAESRTGVTDAMRDELAFIRIELPGEEWAGATAEYLLARASALGGRQGNLILVRLASAVTLPPDVRADATKKLLADPTAEFSMQLFAAELLGMLDREAAMEWIDGLADETLSPENQRDLGAYFVRQGAPDRALALIPRDVAMKRQDLFIVWLDAMAGLGRWDEILLTLQAREAPIEGVMRELYLGRTQDALGDRSRAESHYRAAALAPTADLDQLFYVAGYLSEVGQPELAESVLQRLSYDPATARGAWEAMIKLHRARGDTKALLISFEAMRARWPQDVALQNDALYLAVLLDRDLAQNVESARLLFESHPNLLPVRMTYSLALLKVGRAIEGRNLFQGSAVEVGQLLPHQKVIFAALLRETGMDEAAGQVAERIPVQGLLEEEAELLRPRED